MRREFKAKAAANPLATVDWAKVEASLDERGYATAPALLTPEGCRGLIALYPREDAFRSRVVMQRHAIGHGEYKYLRYPMPTTVEALRQSIYIPVSRRSPTAGASGCGRRAGFRRRSALIWRNAMPPAKRDRRRCCSNTRPATTTACIRISTVILSSRCS